MKIWKLEELQEIRSFFYLPSLYKNIGGMCRSTFIDMLSQIFYTLLNISVWRINFITVGIIKEIRLIQFHVNMATDIGHVAININHMRFVSNCTSRIPKGIAWSNTNKRNSLMLNPIIISLVEQFIAVLNLEPHKDIIIFGHDHGNMICITKNIGWKQCFQMEIII